MKRFIFLFIILGLIAPIKVWSQEQDTLTNKQLAIPLNQEEVMQLIKTAETLLTEFKYIEATKLLLRAESKKQLLINPENKIQLYINLINLHNNAGLSEDAIKYCKNADIIAQEIENIHTKLKIILLTASTYSSLQKYDLSNSYLKRALQIAQELAQSDIVASIFSQLGFNHAALNDNENSIMYYQSAGLIYQSGDKTREKAINALAIGKILLKQINSELTKSSFENALENASKIKMNEVIAESSYHLGRIAKKEQNLLRALSFFQTITELPDDAKTSRIKSKAYQENTNIYEARGESKLALNHAKEANRYLLLANGFEERKASDKFQIKHKITEIKNQFAQKELSSELNKQKNKTTVNRTISFIIIAVLTVIIALLFIRNRRRNKEVRASIKQKQNDIKFLENSLKEFNDKLESEVGQRTKDIQEELNKRLEIDLDLKKALKNAEDANYLKNAFLSNMSHEIRTPLNGIIGFSNLLVTELSIMENQELFEFASGIQESGDRLLHLLNNIIDISRIEANDMEMKLTPCNSNEIIESVSNLYKFKANEKKLKFNTKYNEIPDVLADEQNITKIISDIIDNAVKYTDKGFINVITDYDAEENLVVISVKDTGIGIDESYLKHVFEAFRQESLGYSRNYQGAGLGLPLAKRLVSLMKGDISVESKKGIGTTVKIFLQTSSAPAKIKKEEIKSETLIEETVVKDQTIREKINIFIVEDDRMNRLVLSKMLDKVGNNSLAVDGEETISIIDRAYQNGLIFDVMLFDINLPAPWDGIKLMHEVKNRWKEYKFVPFIAQTAYAMSGDRERLLDSGFDNYIAKPVNKNELINIIFKHIGITEKK